ncbi:flagellar basal-body rod protein FlgC [Chitinivorax tropicus]|uniref:Flagellar basal-body rod protein FlgC n=1 Tax=Chitinivorax tropicus TaxID=714531 RepID=A0A840MT99_9PROT|nr:flagellar basal body rod protein FlgC [Chitinivorax tropicus]MBB5020309.1 flagellar basal-body rod protein FlgC [Chitinivorax tropicus]
MDYRSAFAISAAGMNLEKTRLDVTALNLANMHTTVGPDGKLFQPSRVVASLRAVNFGQQFDNLLTSTNLMLPMAKIETMEVAPRVIHDPGHPDADKNGNVSLPGVNHLNEMINMMSALRAYEANVVAMNAAKVMAQRALDIGATS